MIPHTLITVIYPLPLLPRLGTYGENRKGKPCFMRDSSIPVNTDFCSLLILSTIELPRIVWYSLPLLVSAERPNRWVYDVQLQNTVNSIKVQSGLYYESGYLLTP